MTIKLIETDSEFLETAGVAVECGGNKFFYIPYWYEKISDGLYKQHSFERLPKEIIDIITKNRQNETQTI